MGAVILIAVDQPGHRDLFRRALVSTPHHLVFALDGEDGLDRFFEVKPQLFFAHQQLAKMDGLQLFRAIRNAPQALGVLRVLMGEEGDSGDGLADRFLRLPADEQAVRDFVEVCLQGAPPAAAASTPPRASDLISHPPEPRRSDRPLSEPALPMSNPGMSSPALSEPTLPDLSETARSRAPALDEELPIAAVTQEMDSISVSDARVPGPKPVEGGVSRGLDESQLGRRLSRRVREMHDRIDSMDYYALLGVSSAVDGEAIAAAFFELSLEFHPDRFFLLKAGDLKEKIYQIYRQLGDAYAVLCDPEQRRRYDAQRPDSVDVELDTSTGDLGISADLSWEEATHAGQTQITDAAGGLLRSNLAFGSDDAHRFVNWAVQAEHHQDLAFARLWLHLARQLEPQHEPLAEMIEKLEERMFTDPRAVTDTKS